MSLRIPPDGFTALNRAINTTNKPYDVIGVCVDYFEPAQTKGTDCTMQFVLHDPSWIVDRGMKFRFFNSSMDRLPQIRSNGDVLILRNVMTKFYQQQPLGMSNYSTTWIVLSGSSILESTCPNGSDITYITSSRGRDGPSSPAVDELKYAKEIVALEDPTKYRPPPKATALEVESNMKAAGGTPLPRKDKRQLIQDLTAQPKVGNYNFADLFGEVRKTWHSDYGRVHLSITDYTSNKLLYSYAEEPQSRDGDDFGYAGALHQKWPGPWGRMTIDVILYDAHAEFARSEIKPGMFVLVRNCQIKLDPNGSKLEAACRGDREDMSKVNITIHNLHRAESDDRFKDLLRRRLEYEKVAKAKGLRFGFETKVQQDSKKRTIDSMNDQVPRDDDPVIPNKDSKASKRKRKRDKQKLKITMKALNGATHPNQYVRCNNIDIPLKSINDILGEDTLKRKTPCGNEFILPFQNCCYKSRVRVVDYFPNNLADFSVPYLVSDYDVLSDAGISENLDVTLSAAQSNPHSIRWEWRFFLVLEDAGPGSVGVKGPRPQMAILVADQDGEYLFRDEATDLRANPLELAKLREKLFVLWGDLQERKEEAALAGKTTNVTAQSKPFECFIKEYGVPLPSHEEEGNINGSTEYQRMFRLFGTSI